MTFQIIDWCLAFIIPFLVLTITKIQIFDNLWIVPPLGLWIAFFLFCEPCAKLHFVCSTKKADKITERSSE